ncbi:GNAT family N-acetyltransferase [Streptomyces litchfieldiae]|uniref:GNAT family N-acetyltransferase n=1 Tax=Streptomyces litchfieldiae TaxID=3075543 RepID=A0ABU2N0C9_9ACTN|nr:GNAT family N-acetyltransferase [Streptomyces sp. DSM 44938]MDT0347362.1 GNAT family N-acetyltransferase [Streptomyces sp. DSM 44938]
MSRPARVTLRPTTAEDLPVLFDFQRDPEAVRMAAFTPPDPDDRAAFDARWARLLRDEGVTSRTVLEGGRIVGQVSAWGGPDEPHVSYWVGREHWGRGIAGAALTAFLAEYPVRPLYGAAAWDNYGSLRVLEKCGFTVYGENKDFAAGRGEEVTEVLLVLT